MSTEDTLRDFIVSELSWNGHRQDLTADYPLIDNHVVDSLGLFKLVYFIEEQFGVEVDDAEIVPENFGTLGAISALITRKRGRS